MDRRWRIEMLGQLRPRHGGAGHLPLQPPQSTALLPGYYEPWVLTERQALADRYLVALRQLAAAREEVGDLEGALAAARQAVTSDPLQEEAHYDVMRLAAALGQPSAALRQYQELERILREELDEAPSPEARALAAELRR